MAWIKTKSKQVRTTMVAFLFHDISVDIFINLIWNFMYFLINRHMDIFQSQLHTRCIKSIPVKSHRQAPCRFVTSSHPLRIETGWWARPTLARIYGNCFSLFNKMEDEYHFLMDCPLYNDLRVKLISSNYKKIPSVFNLQQLLNYFSRIQINLMGSGFIYLSFKARGNYVSQHCVT